MGCWGSVPRHIDKNYIYGLPPSGELTPELPSTPLHEVGVAHPKRSLEPLPECDSTLPSRQNSETLQETLPKRRHRNGVSQSAKNAPGRVLSEPGASVETSRSNSSSGRHSTSPAVVTGAAAAILSASVAGPPRQRTSQSVCAPEPEDAGLGATRRVRKAFSTDESGAKGRRKPPGFMVGLDEPEPASEEYSHRDDPRLFHESKRERRHTHLRHKQANRNPRDAERNLRRRHHSRSSSSEEERDRRKRDGDKSGKTKSKGAQKALLVPAAVVHADESPGAERRGGGGSSDEAFEEIGAVAAEPCEHVEDFGAEEERVVVLNGAVRRGSDLDLASDEERRRRENEMETSLILQHHEQLEEEEMKKKEEEEERLRREETEREQDLLMRMREEETERERDRDESRRSEEPDSREESEVEDEEEEDACSNMAVGSQHSDLDSYSENGNESWREEDEELDHLDTEDEAERSEDRSEEEEEEEEEEEYDYGRGDDDDDDDDDRDDDDDNAYEEEEEDPWEDESSNDAVEEDEEEEEEREEEEEEDDRRSDD